MQFRWRIWIGSILLILATIAGLAGLGWVKYRSILAAASAPPPPEMPISVVVAAVEFVPYRARTTVIGTVLAPRWISVSNEVAGTVREILFEPGGVVDAGQALIRLDSEMEVAQLRASEARLQLAETTLKRLRSIRGADAISQLELDEALARRDEAKASVAELSAMIERRAITAPFRGKVGLSDTHVGQYLPAGTTLTTLQSLEGFLYVDCKLPQEVANQVRVGDSVRLWLGNEELTATFIAFDAMADRTTRNLAARVRIDHPPEAMQPGDSVRVVVEYGPAMETATVPVQAVRRSPSGAHVYVAETNAAGETRARQQTIRLGPSNGKRIHILDGLSLQDQVVADGSFKLRDGALIVNAASQPTALTRDLQPGT